MAVEFDPIAEIVSPGIPDTKAAEIVDTPEMTEAEYVVPEITSALTGD